MSLRWLVVLWALGLGWAGRAIAQIVDVQPVITSNEKPGFSGTFEGSLDSKYGNTQLFLLSGSFIARYREGRQLAFFMAKGNLGSEGGTRFIDNDLEHLRYRVDLLPHLQGEAYIQHDRDEFRRLALRGLIGVGPRIPIVDEKALQLAFGTSFFFEEEVYQVGPYPDSGLAQLEHRMSYYGVFLIHLRSDLQFGETVYAEPRVEEPADFRLLSETDLLITLSKLLTLKLSAVLFYESVPPIAVVPYDEETKVSVLVNF